MASLPPTSSSAAVSDDPRFRPITPDDHGGIVAIIATLLMVGMLIFLCIRIFIRVSIRGGLGLDDYVLTLASTLSVGQTVATLISVSRGFGKITDLIEDQAAQIPQIERTTYASDVLFVMAVALSKGAVCLFIKRLTQTKMHQHVAHAILGASIIWGVVSVLVISLRHPVDEPWLLFDHDRSKVLLRWRIIGALDIVTELALSALSMFLVWNLQMPVKLKLMVVTAFSFRLTVIAAIIARIQYLSIGLHDSKDLFFALVPSVLCTQVELHWGLMAATIPCLKPFMHAANTGYMGFGGAATHSSYAMSAMKNSQRNKSTVSGTTSNNNNHHENNDISVPEKSNNNNNSSSSNKGNGDAGPSGPSFLGVAGSWTKIVASRRASQQHETQPHRRVVSRTAEEGNSVSTDGSEAGIIHQTTSFTVEYHENEMRDRESRSRDASSG